MTKEQLMAYLPYDFEIFEDEFNSTHNVIGIIEDEIWCKDDIGDGYSFFISELLEQGYKPILKPIEDAEKYISSEFDKRDNNQDFNQEVIDLFCEEKIYCDESLSDLEITTLPYDSVQWLLKNHYDVFGLLKENKAVKFNQLKK